MSRALHILTGSLVSLYLYILFWVALMCWIGYYYYYAPNLPIPRLWVRERWSGGNGSAADRIGAGYQKYEKLNTRTIIFNKTATAFLRKETLSTKILRGNGNSDVVSRLVRQLATRRAWVLPPLGFDFLSAYHTEVAVGILLKLIFRAFSFPYQKCLDLTF